MHSLSLTHSIDIQLSVSKLLSFHSGLTKANQSSTEPQKEYLNIILSHLTQSIMLHLNPWSSVTLLHHL